MRDNLARWIADIATQCAVDDFQLPAQLTQLNYLDSRTTDLYYSLVGELFDMVREGTSRVDDWASLGRGLDSVSLELEASARADALYFAAVAFFLGGYPASALMTIRRADPQEWQFDVQRMSHDLLARQTIRLTDSTQSLVESVRTGDLAQIEAAIAEATARTARAFEIGPEEWVANRLYLALLLQFQATNLRSVLPDGEAHRWDPLVESFFARSQPVWDFFPSQIEAIDAGLLNSDQVFSLQMPTGAGKTALTETLIFDHLSRSADRKAVLLVPYRALARELRGSVGRHLTSMGMRTRTVYGGTVPGIDERQDVDEVRAFIATPEAFTGLIGARPDLLDAISLVVCDEGHLLDSRSRGVGLELLLARIKVRRPSPRIVFISAIVPNMEEINTWLGGTDATVVTSDYRPSITEFAVLRSQGSGAAAAINLELHDPSPGLPSNTLPGFLRPQDFKFKNPSTGRTNTYKYSSTKTRTVASARKALPLGPVAIFATEKGGDRGAVGLAHEMLKQLSHGLGLPSALDHVNDETILASAVEYLEAQFGAGWIGTKALKAGVVLHHGDVPQETREVLEELVVDRHIAMVICTSTLAEGVNLPLRTLVLYSVKRSTGEQGPVPMLARDIKNLVGRAGRAGKSTRGLVICANPDDWDHVRKVAEGMPVEPIGGALIDLVRALRTALTNGTDEITNRGLEETPQLFSLVDGVDAALIELIREEVGAEDFAQVAIEFAQATFAATKSSSQETLLLQDLFKLRALRLVELRDSGRLVLAQKTSARPRLVDRVLDSLIPGFAAWDTVESPLDPDLISAFVTWALAQPGFEQDVEIAYRSTDVEDYGTSLSLLITAWLQGHSFKDMAKLVGLDLDVLLRIHSKIVLFDFVTLVEQAVAVMLEHASEADDMLSPVVVAFPDYVRFGVSTHAARELMAQGVKHRSAANALSADPQMRAPSTIFATPWSIAREVLQDDASWVPRLGALVYNRTVADVAVRWPGA